MQCLGMSDLEVDLVDQFFCPSCIQSKRSANLHPMFEFTHRMFTR